METTWVSVFLIFLTENGECESDTTGIFSLFLFDYVSRRERPMLLHSSWIYADLRSCTVASAKESSSELIVTVSQLHSFFPELLSRLSFFNLGFACFCALCISMLMDG